MTLTELEPPKIPELLKKLRAERGLSLSAVATRCGVSKGTLSAWESGQTTPKGTSLQKVLVHLRAPEADVALALTLANGANAEQLLRSSRLGPILSSGEILRAIRLQKRMSQSELATGLGVHQSTVARWEIEGIPPSDQTLVDLCRVLKTSPKETELLLAAYRVPAMPDLRDIHQRLDAIFEAPFEIREGLTMAIQREAWFAAARNRDWEPFYGRVLSMRAENMVNENRFVDALRFARSAMGFARPGDTTGLESAIAIIMCAELYIGDRRPKPSTGAETWDMIGLIRNQTVKAFMAQRWAMVQARVAPKKSIEISRRVVDASSGFEEMDRPVKISLGFSGIAFQSALVLAVAGHTEMSLDLTHQIPLVKKMGYSTGPAFVADVAGMHSDLDEVVPPWLFGELKAWQAKTSHVPYWRDYFKWVLKDNEAVLRRRGERVESYSPYQALFTGEAAMSAPPVVVSALGLPTVRPELIQHKTPVADLHNFQHVATDVSSLC